MSFVCGYQRNFRRSKKYGKKAANAIETAAGKQEQPCAIEFCLQVPQFSSEKRSKGQRRYWTGNECVLQIRQNEGKIHSVSQGQ